PRNRAAQDSTTVTVQERRCALEQSPTESASFESSIPSSCRRTSEREREWCASCSRCPARKMRVSSYSMRLTPSE
ncbi:hypothetical protein PFISCL1PPCAC_24582, partial [Pristionchus fissidentatus]